MHPALVRRKLLPYLGRAPWAIDETRYPLTRMRDERGLPVIEWLRRREFPRAVVSDVQNVLLNRGVADAWDCTLTGQPMYWMPPAWIDQDRRSASLCLPWGATREHLVPVHLLRMYFGPLPGSAEAVGNVQPASLWANERFGHMPMGIKMYVKSAFIHFADRLSIAGEDGPGTMSREWACHLLAHKIEVEKAWLFEDGFPWQPWTYAEGSSARAVASEFLDEVMRCVDLPFMTLRSMDKRLAATAGHAELAGQVTVVAQRVLGMHPGNTVACPVA